MYVCIYMCFSLCVCTCIFCVCVCVCSLCVYVCLFTVIQDWQKRYIHVNYSKVLEADYSVEQVTISACTMHMCTHAHYKTYVYDCYAIRIFLFVLLAVSRCLSLSSDQ